MGTWPTADRVSTTVELQRRLDTDRTDVDVIAFVPSLIADTPIEIPAGSNRAVADAERALTRLDTSADSLPTEIAEVVTTALLRTESVSSSRIEGLDVGHRRVSEAIFDPLSAGRLAREVAANTRAMIRAIELGRARRPLTRADINDLHRILMDKVPGGRAGEARTTQSWIGRTDDPRDADYVPPPPNLVPELLEDLVRFLERGNLPETVRAAVAHAQFEAIHPFADGNGRVGRCLISATLRRDRSSDAVPPISGVCVADSDAYYDALIRFQQHADPWPWIEMFCRATVIAAEVSIDLASDVVDLKSSWRDRAGNPRSDSVVHRLIEVLPTHSHLNAALAAELLAVDPNVARRGLNHLERAGVLRNTAGRRNRVWRADSLHHLLDEFANRLGRRA